MSNQRKEFIENLFTSLKDTSYCLLKWTGENPTELPSKSDLDILGGKEVLENTITLIEGFSGLLKWTKQSLHGVNHLYLYFEDNSFLQIDILSSFVRKGIEYLSSSSILKETIVKSGIKTYTNKRLFEHLFLFNTLNYAGVPVKYLSYLSKVTISEQSAIVEYLNNKYDLNLNSLLELRSFQGDYRKKILQRLKLLSQNNLSNQAKNYFLYLKNNCLTAAIKNESRVLSFSGVDGAGKSTLIGQMQKLLTEKYRRKVIVLRHRPSVLPILSAWVYGKEKAEARSTSSLPRQGKTPGKINSFIRFIYYLTDYMLGRIVIWYKYELKNYVVLYDRYFFDFVADNKRSNIGLTPSFTRPFYKCIAKPDINYFLYASPQVILKRKKELEAETITKLTNNYLNLFNDYSQKYKETYLPIENINLGETLNKLENEFVKIA